MLSSRRLPAFAISLLFALPAFAQPTTHEQQFAEALKLLQQKRYADAVSLLEMLAAANPRASNVYWNLGAAEDELGHHAKAAAAWAAFHRLEPNDWQGSEKLVQALQAEGRPADAQREASALVQAWHANTHSELHQQDKFCREIFNVGRSHLAGFEFFEPHGTAPVHFVFAVQSGERRGTQVTLTNDLEATQSLHKKGKLSADESLFVLGLDSGPTKEVYRFYKQRPSYADIRRDVALILTGELPVVSSVTAVEATAN